MLKGNAISQAKYKKYFGKDGRLKIIKQWIFEGKSYSARRDTDDSIGITDDETYYDVSSGASYTYDINKIDELARRLGVMG